MSRISMDRALEVTGAQSRAQSDQVLFTNRELNQ